MSRASRCCRRAAAGGRPWSGGAGPDAAREEDAHAEAGMPKQNEMSGAAANVHAAPPSPSSRRRLHLRPAVRTMAFPFSCVVPKCLSASLRAAVCRCIPMNAVMPRRTCGDPAPWPPQAATQGAPPCRVPSVASCLVFLMSVWKVVPTLTSNER
jgi:hypothetical protein